MKLLTALVDFSFIAAYFFLTDYIGPKLVAAGRTWQWWLILFALVSGSYLFTQRVAPIRRTSASRNRTFVVIAYSLLLITLFLYDFSMRPLLDKHGIGSVWILPLLLTFIAVGVGTWKARQEGRGPSVRSS